MAGFSINLFQDKINVQAADNGSLNAVSEKADKALMRLLDNISNGDTLVGKVLSVSKDSFQILAGEDVIINARAEGSISLTPGSNVLFEVLKSQNNSVSLKPLYQNTASEATCQVALRQAGIPIDTRSIEMTARNMEYGNPIDRASLSESYKDVAMYPNTPVKYIVDLQELNIPRTPENLEQYEAYMNMQNSLAESFSEITDSLLEGLKAEILPQSGETAGLDANAATLKAMPLSGEVSIPEEVLNKLYDTREGVEYFSSSLGREQSFNNLSNSNPILKSQTPILDVLERFSENASSAGDELKLSASEIMKLSDSLKAGGLENSNISSISQNVSEDAGNPAAVLNAVLKDIKESILNPKPGAMVNALTGLEENVTPDEAVRSKALSDFINSSEFKETISRTINSQWTLERGKISDKKEIKDLYNRMLTQTRSLINDLNGLNGTYPKLTAQITNLNNNLNFMEALNSFTPYIQIPFRGEDSNRSGELYVLKNKQSLTSGTGELSAFIHLDMDNLGPTDVFVKMNSDLNVSTNFTLSSEESLKFVADNIHYLNKRLNEKGYSFNAEFKIDIKKASPITEMINQSTSKIMVSKTCFDARV